MVGKGIISHKHAAVQAGLWIMWHNTIFMNPDFGNMVYLGTVLVNTELDEDALMDDFAYIPGCQKCVKACPVSAINNDSVDQKLCRERSFFKVGRGWDLYNCSECRVKCPLWLGDMKK